MVSDGVGWCRMVSVVAIWPYLLQREGACGLVMVSTWKKVPEAVRLEYYL